MNVYIIIFLIVIIALSLGLGLGLGLKSDPEQYKAKGVSETFGVTRMGGVEDGINFAKKNEKVGGNFMNGGISPNNKVVFAANNSNFIGRYDMNTAEFELSEINLSNKEHIGNNDRKYFSGAVHTQGNNFVLIPFNTNCICEYNYATDEIEYIITDFTSAPLNIANRSGVPTYPSWWFTNGISFNENIVVFVPGKANHIIIYDKKKDKNDNDKIQTISLGVVTNIGNNSNFNDATIIGNSVYFCPEEASCILKLTITTNSDGTYNSGALEELLFYEDNGGPTDGIDRGYGFPFGGIASVGNILYFAPYNHFKVMKYDTAAAPNSRITEIDIGLINDGVTFGHYMGAVALNGIVYFSPYEYSNFVKINTNDNDKVDTFNVNEDFEFENKVNISYDSLALYRGFASKEILDENGEFKSAALVYVPFDEKIIFAYGENSEQEINGIQVEKTDGIIKFKGCDKTFYFTGGIIDKIENVPEDAVNYAFADCDGRELNE